MSRMNDIYDIKDNKNVETLECKEGCCQYRIVPYHQTYYSNHLDQIKTKIKKAGSFIYDSKNHKILLVQSRGQMWGPPQGTLKPDETPLECALREVTEETGLILNDKLFNGSIVIKSKALYYFTDTQEKEVNLQFDMEDNDANGIGWFNVNCLNDLVHTGKISINQHCRILIKRIFNKEIVFNTKI
jgi:8-oxo-dGTP pyrophosphatase MutT (NUDIX family)